MLPVHNHFIPHQITESDFQENFLYDILKGWTETFRISLSILLAFCEDSYNIFIPAVTGILFSSLLFFKDCRVALQEHCQFFQPVMFYKLEWLKFSHLITVSVLTLFFNLNQAWRLKIRRHYLCLLPPKYLLHSATNSHFLVLPLESYMGTYDLQVTVRSGHIWLNEDSHMSCGQPWIQTKRRFIMQKRSFISKQVSVSSNSL